MKSMKKLFWGILFIVSAILLVVWGMGYLENFGIWSILASIVLAGIFIEGIIRMKFGMMMFAVAIFFIINDKWLGLGEIPTWIIIVAAVLITIGLYIIFPNARRKNKWVHNHFGAEEWKKEYISGEGSGEKVHFEVAFSEAVKYINSSQLCFLHTECAFGALKVYFDDTALKEGTAMAEVECSFGTTIYYVPSSWTVITDIDCAFGGCEEKGRCNPSGENTLRIVGDVSFGSLEVQYI